MIITREKGWRMWGGGAGNAESSSVSGGGGFSLMVEEGAGTGNAYTDFTYESGTLTLNKATEFVTVDFFNKLFTAYDSNGNVIAPNNTTPTLDNIKFKAGAWTEQYLSALGQNSSGGGGGGGGTVTGIKIGSSTTTYTPTDGIVTLPAYPTSVTWANVTGKPSWIGSSKPTYAIGEIQNSALSGNGFLKKTGTNTWGIDTNTYITGNQTITLSGDVSGSGATSISVTIGQGKVTNAMLAGSIANGKLQNSSVTVNGTSVSLGDSITTEKWGTARNITIKDADSTNSGTAVSVNGSDAVTLLLPSTIKATLSGNASSATLASTVTTTADTTNTLYVVGVTSSATTTLKRDTSITVKGGALSAGSVTTTGNVSIGGTLGVTGAATLSSSLSVASGITLTTTKKIYFGDTSHYLELNSTGFHFSHGVYSDSFVSALGANSSGGGGGGTVTGIKLASNTSAINPDSNGIVTIPAATGSAFGVLKVGNTLSVSSGTINLKDSYLPLTGGTLTGTLSVNNITASGGQGLLTYHPTEWTGVSSTQWGVGAADSQGVIRSSNTNLIHYRHTTSGTTDYVILDESNYSSYALPLTGGTLSGNVYISNKNKGYWLTDSAGTSYAAIYDNGTNLWIGATETSGTHHTGSTYISSGSGNTYISRLVSGTRTNYIVLDSGNYSSYALPLSGGTLTGNLTVNTILLTNEIAATNSNGLLAYKPTTTWAGISSTQWGVGAGDVQGVIRSGGRTNLLHYDATAVASYVILDTNNTYVSSGTGYINGTAITTISGNAGTATSLATSRSIWGQSFNGSADIPITAIAKMPYVTFKNYDDNENAGYCGRGSTTTNDIALFAYSGNQLILGAGGSSIMYLSASNNVGIGTSSPTSQLHVIGNAQEWSFHSYGSASSSNFTSFYAAHGSGVAGMWCGVSSTSTSSYIAQFRGGITDEGSGGNVVMNIMANGKVGINTETPSSNLTVDGTITCRCDYYSNTNPSLGNLDVGTVSIKGATSDGKMNKFGCYIWLDTTSGATKFQGGYEGGLSTNTLPIVFQPLGGRVGIGTHSPSYPLHVVGNIYGSSEITAASDERKKNIISNTKFNVKDIASARSVLFEWNDGRDDDMEKKIHGGSIAQDWLGKADSFLSQDGDGWYSINYGALALCSAITIARETVKHGNEIERLKKEVVKLRERVAELEERRVA